MMGVNIDTWRTQRTKTDYCHLHNLETGLGTIIESTARITQSQINKAVEKLKQPLDTTYLEI